MLFLIAVTAMSCSSKLPPAAFNGDKRFEAPSRHEIAPYASSKTIAEFEAGGLPVYTMAPGDKITVTVWGHDDLSGKHLIGPDGRITIPVLGSQHVAYLTADQAGKQISAALASDYLEPVATVEVDTYDSNHVLILGRVTNPGNIHFDNVPYLLDALAKAGTLPVGGVGADKAAMNRCAIFRGRNEIVWINLRALMKGRDLSLNIQLRRDDIIYIPDADDQLVYVMGEVTKPGAYRLTPDMSFMDALAQAGGPTDNAAKNRIVLARPSIGVQKTVDLNEYIHGHAENNYMLEEGDVIYLEQSTLAKIGYMLQQFNPATQTILSASVLFR